MSKCLRSVRDQVPARDGDAYALSARRAGPSPGSLSPVQEQPPCSPPSRFRGSRLPGSPAVYRADERESRFAMARRRSGGPGPWLAATHCRATAFSTSSSASSCADPMCSMSRDPRWTSTRPGSPLASTRSSRSAGRGYTGQTLRPRFSAHIRSPRATNLQVRAMSQPKILDREPGQWSLALRYRP